MAVFKAAITSYVKRQNMSNKKPLKILIEASGCLTSSYMIEAIKNAGHIVCGSDIDSFNTAFIECDDFIIMPKVSDPHLCDKTLHLCRAHHIDIVIPTLDESLLGWSEQKAHFAQYGILVIISAPHTIQTFLDKWQTYQFFCQIGIPTPKSSLYKHYGVLNPRFGRGGSGIELAQIDRFFNGGGDNDEDSLSFITQEHIIGEEYTIDCLFNAQGEAIYIIPRRRIGVQGGKSTKGEVCDVKCLESHIQYIASHIHFIGAINIQAFITKENKPIFIEVNPRLGGGSALSFAASENWVEAMIEMFVYHRTITPKPIRYGLKMARSYKEIYF